jgi:protein-tyrosine-phosphatase
MFQVLLVCTGNTCRSPMAEGILKSLLPAEIAGNVRIVSAGTGALPGTPAAPLAIRTLASEGIDIRGHRSAELTVDRVRQSDLILGMEPQHLERARELVPGIAGRIHLITEQGAGARGNPGRGVADPIGAGEETYQDTYHRIRSHLLQWIPVIREAVERRERV